MAKSVDLTSDDLDGHVGAFLDKCSQETASTTKEDSQPDPLKRDQQGDGKSSHDPAGVTSARSPFRRKAASGQMHQYHPAGLEAATDPGQQT